MVWGLRGFLGWSSLYEHERITLGINGVFMTTLQTANNVFRELSIMIIMSINFSMLFIDPCD